MADIPINPVTRRVEFTGNTGTGPFAFTFNVLAQADIAVYKNNTLLALTSDYTVSLNSNGTGSITLVAALIASDELVIIGDLPLSRTTDFVTAGDLLASSLNQQFDSNVVMSQQLDERFDRTIRSQPGDINKNLYLPLVSSRASQLLSFDSSGNITTTSLANVPDIGTVNLTVSGVASFADGSLGAPSITNIGDTNTGIYFPAADQLAFTAGGNNIFSITSTYGLMSKPLYFNDGILLTDNSATALTIKEGSNNYLTIDTTNGSEKISFGSTANPTFEVNGSFRQPLIAAATSFFSQTYSGASLLATNGSVNIESYSASKAGIVLNGSGDQITFTSPTLGFVGLVQVVGAITTDTSLNIASSTTVDGILDEDDMASNSATKLATQQSIKAYVDAQVGTVDTLAEVLGNGNTTGANNIIVTAGQSITVDTISETTAANGVVIDGVTLKDGGATVTADVSFGDNDKAIFGAGSDLQIYHDGFNSIIEDVGNGYLDIKTNGQYILLRNTDGNNLAYFETGGGSHLYWNGVSGLGRKLQTTSTGIDVTGTITADGLTVDGTDLAVSFNGSSKTFVYLTEGDTTDLNTKIYQSGGSFGIQTIADDLSTSKNRVKVDHSTGDISFYDDQGSSQSFYWDASAESLGIGTSLPSVPLHINTSGTSMARFVGGNDGNLYITNDSANVVTLQAASGDALSFNTNGGNERMTIDSSGDLTVKGGRIFINESDNGNTAIGLTRDADEGYVQVYSAGSITTSIRGNGDSYFNGGNVGIGTDSPSTKVEISGAGFQTLSVTSTNSSPVLKLNSAASSVAYLQWNNAGSSPLSFYDLTASAERMRIGSSGVVDIKNVGSEASPSLIFGGDDDTGLFKPISNTLAFSTFGSEAMRIDSSGNVGIGQTPINRFDVTSSAIVVSKFKSSAGGSGARAIHLLSGNGNSVDGLVFISCGSTSTVEGGANAATIRNSENAPLIFGTNNTERMRIDSSGNVGIGVVPQTGGSTWQHVQFGGTGNLVSRISDSTVDAMFASNYYVNVSNVDSYITTGAAARMFFNDNTISFDQAASGTAGTAISWSEAMRIDSSGNLLVGTTDSRPDNFTSGSGTAISEAGIIRVARGGDTLVLNRVGSDGTIATFRKNGTTVGSIASRSGSTSMLHLNPSSTNGAGIGGATKAILPTDHSALSDNNINLGSASVRFKDLYLSGGVYLGGTGAANYLDDYEEGYYTVTVSPSTSGTMTLNAGYDQAFYIKVGRKVSVTGRVRLSSVSSPVGQMVNFSIPFVVANLNEEAERAMPTVLVQNAAQDTSNYIGHPTGSGNSYTQIGRSNSYGTNAAPDFSGDEFITVNLTYFTD